MTQHLTSARIRDLAAFFIALALIAGTTLFAHTVPYDRVVPGAQAVNSYGR